MSDRPASQAPAEMVGAFRLGSLFAGCGGLDLAVAEVFGAETVFVADVCKVNKDGSVGHHEPHRAPCSILAHRFPDAPNLGDVAQIEWTPDCPDCGTALRAVNETPGEDGYIYWCPTCRGEFPVSIRPTGMPAPIDVLCAGFPCQDVSVAGNRAGLKDGTRTGLWSEVVRAIRELQPRLVILENVPGIFTAPAAGDMERCPWCVGDGPDGLHLRALDAVLADLAALGFDAEWCVVPASGVGAPHRRERWFCAAYHAGQPWRIEPGGGATAT